MNRDTRYLNRGQRRRRAIDGSFSRWAEAATGVISQVDVASRPIRGVPTYLRPNVRQIDVQTDRLNCLAYGDKISIVTSQGYLPDVLYF